VKKTNNKIRKNFKVLGLVGFDFFRLGKDGFYNLLDQEYKKQFGADIEIIEADFKLITNGVSVSISQYKIND